MKKYFIGFVLIVVFALYIVLNNQSSSSITASLNTPPSASTTDQSSQGQSGTGLNSGPGQYKNGTFTGSVSDAIYGSVQVAAVISGGKLTDVQFLQYPNSGGHTQEVTAMSLPVLKSEAIQAQSANVNFVSGATQTSQAFQQSLASALSQAQA